MQTFKKFWISIPTAKRKDFAHACGTTANYLNMIAHGQKPLSNETLALNIEIQSGNKITVADILPEFAALLELAGYRKRKSSK